MAQKCGWCNEREISMRFDAPFVKVGTFKRVEFCSEKCRQSYIGSNNNSNDSEQTSDGNQAPSKPNNTLVGSTINQVGGGIGKGIGKGLDKLGEWGDAERKREEDYIDNKVSDVSQVRFSQDTSELENQLQELIALGMTIPSKRLEIRKAIYSKLTIGLNQLKMKGDSSNIQVIEEQIKGVKPKWYHFIFKAMESS